MMRISIVDLGTNTFKLIIATIHKGDFQILEVVKRGVQLGKESYQHNKISEAAFLRAKDCLLEFKDISNSFNAPIAKAFATAVVRDSSNGEDFKKAMKEKTGITIQTLSGNNEAELIMKGAMSVFPSFKYPAVIMDIGGGSTEFIFVKAQKMVWRKSFSIGASRLLQEFDPSDPVSKKDVKKLIDFLNDELSELKDRFSQTPFSLIGSSGSFETFADMIALEINKDSQKPMEPSVQLNSQKLHQLVEQLTRSSREERLKMSGLPLYRVDTIVLSGLMTQWFIQEFQPENIWTSYRSMKEGVLVERINN